MKQVQIVFPQLVKDDYIQYNKAISCFAMPKHILSTIDICIFGLNSRIQAQGEMHRCFGYALFSFRCAGIGQFKRNKKKLS